MKLIAIVHKNFSENRNKVYYCIDLGYRPPLFSFRKSPPRTIYDDFLYPAVCRYIVAIRKMGYEYLGSFDTCFDHPEILKELNMDSSDDLEGLVEGLKKQGFKALYAEDGELREL